jgi:hypothetical protein
VNDKLNENASDVFDAMVALYDGTISPIDLAGLDPKAFVVPVLWIIDATSMSLYCVARLQKPSK